MGRRRGWDDMFGFFKRDDVEADYWRNRAIRAEEKAYHIGNKLAKAIIALQFYYSYDKQFKTIDGGRKAAEVLEGFDSKSQS